MAGPKSRVLEKLRRGELVRTTSFKLDDRSLEIGLTCGDFDCVWLDSEHQGIDHAKLESQIRLAKHRGVDTVIRVARGSYSDLIRPLEMDASGIMVPHCMSAADARAIAEQTRFHPIGRRPFDGSNADGD